MHNSSAGAQRSSDCMKSARLSAAGMSWKPAAQFMLLRSPSSATAPHLCAPIWLFDMNHAACSTKYMRTTLLQHAAVKGILLFPLAAQPAMPGPVWRSSKGGCRTDAQPDATPGVQQVLPPLAALVCDWQILPGLPASGSLRGAAGAVRPCGTSSAVLRSPISPGAGALGGAQPALRSARLCSAACCSPRAHAGACRLARPACRRREACPAPDRAGVLPGLGWRSREALKPRLLLAGLAYACARARSRSAHDRRLPCSCA